MRIFILAIALAASGCKTGDVYQMAGGNYRVTTSAITSFGGTSQARSSGIKRANAYCAGQGKKAVVVDTATDANIAQGTSDVTFQCVAKES